MAMALADLEKEENIGRCRAMGAPSGLWFAIAMIAIDAHSTGAIGEHCQISSKLA
jgi:thymidine phosphorylase